MEVIEVRRLSRAGRLLLVLILCLVPVAGSCAQPGHRYLKLTILHTNDTHAHLLPFSYPTVMVIDGKRTDLPAYRDIGGIARRATVINQLKSSSRWPVLVMDAGDILDGSPFSVEFNGEADIAAMNAAGYDVMTAGNHESYGGLSRLRTLQHQAHFPLLAANVLEAKDDRPVLQPYVIEVEDGLTVAVLGLTLPLDNMRGATIEDPLAAAREWVPKLRSDADAVILLTHIGYDKDLAIASQVPGIDAIIGGHTHTRLAKPLLVKRDDPPSAFWVGGTVVAQAFQWAGELGCVELIFRKGDSGWTLMSYSGRLIPITSDIPDDPVVHAVVEDYHRQIAAKYDRVVGRAEADFTGESHVNLLCDILRETFNADFSLAGSVRSKFVGGPITVADVSDYFPFDNTVVTFDISGADLKKVLAKHKPTGSNLEYTVRGSTLVSAQIGGHDIEDDKTYSGVANSYLAWCFLPRKEAIKDTGKGIRHVVVQYLESKESISPDPKARVHAD